MKCIQSPKRLQQQQTNKQNHRDHHVHDAKQPCNPNILSHSKNYTNTLTTMTVTTPTRTLQQLIFPQHTHARSLALSLSLSLTKHTWASALESIHLSIKFQNWRVNAGSDIMCFTDIF